MLRVFKPTSPMSVGTWVLGGSRRGVTASLRLRAAGVLPRVRLAAEVAVGAARAAALHLHRPCCSPTPRCRSGTRRAASCRSCSRRGAAASAGAAALLVTPVETRARRAGWRCSARAVELAASQTMERRLGTLAEPYHRERAGRLAGAAKAHARRRRRARGGRRPAPGARIPAGRGDDSRGVRVRAAVDPRGRPPVGGRPPVHGRITAGDGDQHARLSAAVAGVCARAERG